jgi:hypothetical protein
MTRRYAIVPFDAVLLPVGQDPVALARDIAAHTDVDIPDEAVGVVLDPTSPGMYRVAFEWEV